MMPVAWHNSFSSPNKNYRVGSVEGTSNSVCSGSQFVENSFVFSNSKSKAFDTESFVISFPILLERSCSDSSS